ncbi:MAG: hypothetical protein KJ675_14555 [Gammaproteobacteria bacterium]|nr:hypothetical protein [Gammaproteobacteria bacterium]
MSTKYQVIIRGVNDNFSRKQVISNLALLFKTSEDKITQVFSKSTFVVKRWLDLDAAKKYLEAIEKCGCICVLEQENHPAPAPAPESKSESVSKSEVIRQFELQGQVLSSQ